MLPDSWRSRDDCVQAPLPARRHLFFTVAVHERGSQHLVQRAALLKACVRAEQRLAPFSILAAVIMPDHLHMVWRLPEGDSDYPNRWRRIKTRFSRALPRLGPLAAAGRAGRGERGIWQRRYWEHAVRGEAELAACINYVHFNPVKHGYADRPEDWPHSTYRPWQDRQWRCSPFATSARRFYKLDRRTDPTVRRPSTGNASMTSPALTLRPATEDDLPFLLALRKATMTEHLRRAGARDDDEHHLARIRHRFEDAHIVWADGRPAGLFKASREAADWRVVQIQIAPAFQGQGLGRRLLSALLEQADARGASVTLSVLQGNPARRLYESLGFTPVEEKEQETEMRYRPGMAPPAA